MNMENVFIVAVFILMILVGVLLAKNGTHFVSLTHGKKGSAWHTFLNFDNTAANHLMPGFQSLFAPYADRALKGAGWILIIIGTVQIIRVLL